MNPIKKLTNWMLNKDERRTVAVPLDPNPDREIKALRQENASLKAQLGRISAQEKIKIEEEKQIDEEQLVIQDLNKQKKEIDITKFGETVSLTKFFLQILKNRKFKESLELTDKDDKTVMGKFGDILTSESGEWIIVDQYNNPMSYGKRLSDIIFKPETFGMQLKRGRILLPFDKDYNSARDYSELEINDVQWNEEEGKFQETQMFRDKANKLLMEKVAEIRSLSADVERLEKTVINTRMKMLDLEKANRNLKIESQTGQTELSLALEQSNQLVTKRDDMLRSIANLQSLKALYENRINVYDSLVKKLLSRFEQSDKTQYEQVKEEIQSDIEWAKNVVPEQITIEKREEPIKPQMALPGQRLGNAASPPEASKS